MVERKEYMHKLTLWQDKQIIKVVTGIRRCGKSTLLKMFREHLLASGVEQEQIIDLNFEDFDNVELLNPEKLYEYLLSHLVLGKMSYIFLDEIQKVQEFERVVNSLYLKPNVDIYITGSNAYLLSGELATFLSGRYVEIKMLPLSFGEYANLKGEKNIQVFKRYLVQGGFPYLAVANADADEEMNRMYLEGIYSTIVLKDIEERYQRHFKDMRMVTDLSLLKNITRYLAANVGNFSSVKKIVDYLTSAGRKVAFGTVDGYLRALIEAYLFYPVERFDIKGKYLLKTNPKYYIADLGLRNYLLQKKEFDLGGVLENVVYLELLRRGFRINVGKMGVQEVDFVAQLGEDITYVQVCANMLDENTFKREMAPLEAIADNYEKIIITLDQFTAGNYGGIRVINAVEWLGRV